MNQDIIQENLPVITILSLAGLTGVSVFKRDLINKIVGKLMKKDKVR